MKKVAAVLAMASLLASVSCSGQIPEERFVNINGVEIAYRLKGEGEPVLLIPNLVGDSFVSMMKESVLDDFQLIQFHLPGQGHSGDYEGPNGPRALADFAAELLHHLNIDRAHLVGHSSAATVALGLAMTNPELVHSLVLLEPPHFPYNGFNFQAAVAQHQDEIELTAEFANVLPWIQGNDTRPLNEQIDAIMTWIADDSDWEERLSPSIPDLREQLMRVVRTDNPRARPTDNPELALPFERSDLQGITQPTLWVWSEERAAAQVVGYHQLTELIPHMQTEYVSDVKHGLQIVAPGPVAEVVARFIGRNPID